MAVKINPLKRIDPKVAEEMQKIQEQMKKDLGIKISDAQASRILFDEKQLKKGGRLKF